MDQIMNKLQSSFILSLLFISFHTYANRPAEDDPYQDNTSTASQNSSNIPVPNDNIEHIPEAPEIIEQSVETEISGDVVELETPSNTHTVTIIDFPRRGMDMSKVANELGEPTTRHPAIGKPPITRWDYPDRTVFFEHSHVIHVVAR